MIDRDGSPPFAGRELRGVHAGLLVFLGIAAANVGNYIFHLISARSLGPALYGDVATLSALAGLVALPLGGAQLFVARQVALFAAQDDEGGLRAFSRSAMRVALSGGAVVTVALLLVAPGLRSLLSLSALAALGLTVLTTVPATLTPVVVGVAQGLQRFGLVALGIGVAPLLRAAVAAAFIAAGLGVTGAMAATLFATLAAVALPALFLGSRLLGRGADPSLGPPRREARQLVPIVGGLLALTVATSADIAVAKAVFDDEAAGVYGAASLVGRVVLYLPAAIVLVLLPKVTARVAQQRAAANLLTASLVVTGLFCAGATLLYALFPAVIVDTAFGDEFSEAEPFLWLFGLAMSAFALLNVLLTYHLAQGSYGMSWLLVGGAVTQMCGFAVFHESPRQLIGVSIAVGVGLLVVHELTMDRSLTRAVRWRST